MVSVVVAEWIQMSETMLDSTKNSVSIVVMSTVVVVYWLVVLRLMVSLVVVLWLHMSLVVMNWLVMSLVVMNWLVMSLVVVSSSVMHFNVIFVMET